MDEITSKSKLWDNNLNLWHDCKESPKAKWKAKRDKVLKDERKRKIAKLKTPVFCHSCNKGILPTKPCKHMIKDGFEIGVDGPDFYADTFKAIQRREQLKKKNKPKPLNLDSFH